jgi:fibroblast growth factor receptor 1
LILFDTFVGSTPYPGLSSSEVLKRVRDGYRLEKPEHCKREIYNIMYYCWNKNPDERPSFSALVQDFETLLVKETDYIDLNMFPEHAYYNELSLSGEKV